MLATVLTSVFLAATHCPTPATTQSAKVEAFDVHRYEGVWYEIAYHDATQVSVCACTRLDWRLNADGNTFKDRFTTKCPYARGATFTVPMRGSVDSARPGVFNEVTFPDWIVDYHVDPSTGTYDWAIQFQCKETLGAVYFTGINLLSRTPTVQPEVMTAMLASLKAAGLERFGGRVDLLTMVKHDACTYPP